MLTVNDIIRIVITLGMPESTIAQMVLHYRLNSGGDISVDDALAAIITSLETAWANIEAHVADTVLGQTAKLLLWDSALSRFDEKASDVITGFDGTSVNPMLPHGTAAVV
ncbi:MAG: hypothetical protein KAJ07_13495, partial [Planctomycetes bacterium]|nr:hypothetical protein [Planctomycetota bacterium]